MGYPSLQEDSGEGPGSQAHIISTLTRKLEWPALIISTVSFPPTVIGQFSVACASRLLFNVHLLLHNNKVPTFKVLTRKVFWKERVSTVSYPLRTRGSQCANHLVDWVERLYKSKLTKFRWDVGSIFVEGCDAFAEDEWDTFTIGRLAFHGVKLCSRCKVLFIPFHSSLLNEISSFLSDS